MKKGFIFLLSGFFILIWLFSLFLINYKSNQNLIFYQNELLDKLKEKEDMDFVVTGLKLIAKNSKTKEEFLKNLILWSIKSGIKYKIAEIFIDNKNNTVYFYSNSSLFKNYLEIEYKGKTYKFRNITF